MATFIVLTQVWRCPTGTVKWEGEPEIRHFPVDAPDNYEAARVLIRSLVKCGTALEHSEDDGWITLTSPAVLCADLPEFKGLLSAPALPNEVYEVTIHFQICKTMTEAEWWALAAEQQKNEENSPTA